MRATMFHKIGFRVKGISMTEDQLENKLTELRSLPGETEVIEFKEAKNDFHFDRLGKYFGALCNEANLKGTPEVLRSWPR